MKTPHLVQRLTHTAEALADDSNIDGRREERKLATLELPCLQRLDVTSPSFQHGKPIPERHAGSGGTSPPLHFGDVPMETKQLVLVCEDPDVHSLAPFVHWTAYSIEPITKSIPEGVLPGPLGKGFKQGRNSTGHDGFTGPLPPAGDPPHHYHFQLFALDTTVSLAAGADRDSLVRAMMGHVIATGDLVGTYRSAP